MSHGEESHGKKSHGEVSGQGWGLPIRTANFEHNRRRSADFLVSHFLRVRLEVFMRFEDVSKVNSVSNFFY